jgi:hypothetical protein
MMCEAAKRDEVGRFGLAAVGPVFDLMDIDAARVHCPRRNLTA